MLSEDVQHNVQILFIFSTIRKLVTLYILYSNSFPLYIKMFIIFLCDGIDCDLLKNLIIYIKKFIKNICDNFIDCKILDKNKIYQVDYSKSIFDKFVLYKDDSGDFCQSIYYQMMDKLSDTFYHIIILYYLYSRKIFSNNLIILFLILLLLRIIGVMLYILKGNDKKFLVYFPNFFEIFIFFFVILKDFNIKLSKNLKILLIILLLTIQIINEYVRTPNNKLLKYFNK